MTHVFVSGCFDILHGGHIAFLSQAKALGEKLTVAIASDASLWRHKRRRPSVPLEHKVALLGALKVVDDVVISTGSELGLDFEPQFRSAKPNVLAVTTDDRFAEAKRRLCAEVGATYVTLPKEVNLPPISTSGILSQLSIPSVVPLRVDFAGGWLDVPRLARPGGYIVNCAVGPPVSPHEWPYRIGGGLGGSAAHAILCGRPAVAAELAAGVGWQDPAVLTETGVCVWRSGALPVLDFKTNGDWLTGAMAIRWTGEPHRTASLVDRTRDYELILLAGQIARRAVLERSLPLLARACSLSLEAQTKEGMPVLDAAGALACKYCGAGHGGYVLYLFEGPEARNAFVARHGALSIEPFLRDVL